MGGKKKEPERQREKQIQQRKQCVLLSVFNTQIPSSLRSVRIMLYSDQHSGAAEAQGEVGKKPKAEILYRLICSQSETKYTPLAD